ncbi:MAG: hypothetical protein ACOX4Z_11385 [Desulfobulbus sp.]
MPPHKEALAHHVIGLVRAGVVEVFPLDVNLRATEMAAQILCIGQRRGPARIIGHKIHIFLPKTSILAGRLVGTVEFGKGCLQDLGDECAAPLAVIPFFHARIS